MCLSGGCCGCRRRRPPRSTFFHDTATTGIFKLSLHDAQPIYKVVAASSDESFKTTNVKDAKRCVLSGGGTVESGWSGNDTGDNHCNNCFCSNGALGCTKMACRVLIPTSGPEPRTSVPAGKPSAGPTSVAGENHIIRLVGNDVGDIAPDFSVLLTNGETVSSSDIRSKNTPIFLFFFSPF